MPAPGRGSARQSRAWGIGTADSWLLPTDDSGARRADVGSRPCPNHRFFLSQLGQSEPGKQVNGEITDRLGSVLCIRPSERGFITGTRLDVFISKVFRRVFDYVVPAR